LNRNAADECNSCRRGAEGGRNANGSGEGRVEDGVYEAAKAIACGCRGSIVIIIIIVVVIVVIVAPCDGGTFVSVSARWIGVIIIAVTAAGRAVLIVVVIAVASCGLSIIVVAIRIVVGRRVRGSGCCGSGSCGCRRRTLLGVRRDYITTAAREGGPGIGWHSIRRLRYGRLLGDCYGDSTVGISSLRSSRRK